VTISIQGEQNKRLYGLTINNFYANGLWKNNFIVINANCLLISTINDSSNYSIYRFSTTEHVLKRCEIYNRHEAST
jgi:hypothetical protein